MRTKLAGLLALMLPLVCAHAALAHHSLANHDTTPVRVKGRVVQVHLINPHSIVYIEEARADGQVRRWAVEGPSGFQLRRQQLDVLLKPGDMLEVCGYMPKEPLVWQVASADPQAGSLSGRLITAELLVLYDGKERSWGDYGLHHCFPPGYRDQHSK